LVYSKPLEAAGGYRHQEAIMLLRRFYVTENVNGKANMHKPVSENADTPLVAPTPRDKSKRAIKTDIAPLPSAEQILDGNS